MSLRFGLLGAGRIGQTHARAIASLGNATIAAVFDPVEAAAVAIRDQYGAKLASVEAIMADKAIDAVLICTPTDLHAAQIEQAARAGKAIFCEKPIDLSVERVRACLSVVAQEKATLMIGFNRRFDPNFTEMRRRIDAGAIGTVEMVQITSRDPAPPPLAYIGRSGGLFRDMMIHDFDMARFMLGEEVTEVFATGSALVDPAIGKPVMSTAPRRPCAPLRARSQSSPIRAAPAMVTTSASRCMARRAWSARKTSGPPQ